MGFSTISTATSSVRTRVATQTASVSASTSTEIHFAARMDPRAKVNQSMGIKIRGLANLAGAAILVIVDFARRNTQSMDVKKKEELCTHVATATTTTASMRVFLPLNLSKDSSRKSLIIPREKDPQL